MGIPMNRLGEVTQRGARVPIIEMQHVGARDGGERCERREREGRPSDGDAERGGDMLTARQHVQVAGEGERARERDGESDERRCRQRRSAEIADGTSLYCANCIVVARAR